MTSYPLPSYSSSTVILEHPHIDMISDSDNPMFRFRKKDMVSERDMNLADNDFEIFLKKELSTPRFYL